MSLSAQVIETKRPNRGNFYPSFSLNPSRAAFQKERQAPLRVRQPRAALSVLAHAVHDAHARAACLDPPHVPGAAGEVSRRAQLKGRLRLKPQALLGHIEVREQDLFDARYECLSWVKGEL